jgi:hypothetical protein
MLYQEWMEEGKRGIVKKALQTVVSEGLKNPHHLYVTFRTYYPGVVLSDTLRSRYPEEMTIIINDAFWNLVVKEEAFSIELLFEDQKETIRVPFQALVNFIDPSVEFALQFDWELSCDPLPATSNIIFIDKFRRPQ